MKEKERVRWSASRVKRYKSCELSYDLRYNQHLKNTNDTPQPDVEKGLMIHLFAELVAKAIIKNERVVKSILLKQVAEKYDISIIDSKAYYLAVDRVLAFFKTFKGGITTKKFEIVPEKWENWKIGKNEFNGIIDLLLIDKTTKEIYIIDYKSSKSKDMSRHKFQLMIYTNYLFQNYNYNLESDLPKIHVGIFYPYVAGDNVEFLKFEGSEEFYDFESEITSILDEIKTKTSNKEKFYPKTSFMCRYCDFEGFNEYCPVSSIMGKRPKIGFNIGKVEW